MSEVKEVQETFAQRLKRKGEGWVGPTWHLLANKFTQKPVQPVRVTLHGNELVVSVDGMERLVVHFDGPASVVVRQHE